MTPIEKLRFALQVVVADPENRTEHIMLLSAALSELEALRKAAKDVLTDYAQDALEDPVGHRVRLPLCSIHISAINALTKAVTP